MGFLYLAGDPRCLQFGDRRWAMAESLRSELVRGRARDGDCLSKAAGRVDPSLGSWHANTPVSLLRQRRLHECRDDRLRGAGAIATQRLM